MSFGGPEGTRLCPCGQRGAHGVQVLVLKASSFKQLKLQNKLAFPHRQAVHAEHVDVFARNTVRKVLKPDEDTKLIIAAATPGEMRGTGSCSALATRAQGGTAFWEVREEESLKGVVELSPQEGAG